MVGPVGVNSETAHTARTMVGLGHLGWGGGNSAQPVFTQHGRLMAPCGGTIPPQLLTYLNEKSE